MALKVKRLIELALIGIMTLSASSCQEELSTRTGKRNAAPAATDQASTAATAQVLDGDPARAALGLWETGSYKVISPGGEQFTEARDFRVDCPIRRAVFFCGDGYVQGITAATSDGCPIYGCVAAAPSPSADAAPINLNCPVLNAFLICGQGKSPGIARYTANHCPVYACLDDTATTPSSPVEGPTVGEPPVSCPVLDYSTGHYCDPAQRDACGNCINTPSMPAPSQATCRPDASYLVSVPVACTNGFPRSCTTETWRYRLVASPGPRDGQGAPGTLLFCTDQAEVGHRSCQWRDPHEVAECQLASEPVNDPGTVYVPPPSGPLPLPSESPQPTMPPSSGTPPSDRPPLCRPGLFVCEHGIRYDANGCAIACNPPP